MESPDRISLVYDFLANGTLGDRLRDSGSDGAAAGGHGGVGDVIAGGGGEDGESRSRRRPKESLSTANLVAVVKDVVDGMIYLHEVGDVQILPLKHSMYATPAKLHEDAYSGAHFRFSF